MVWQTTEWKLALSFMQVAFLQSVRARLRISSFLLCRNILWLELKLLIQSGYLLCTHEGNIPLLE